MDLEKLTPDYHIEKLFDIQGVSDPRTTNLLTFYCKIWILGLCYVLLSLLYFIWLPAFKKTKGTWKPMEGFIVVYNGFMFGCYGTGLAVSYWAINGFDTFYNCSSINFGATDPKSTMVILMAVCLSYLKMIRFFEPLMYQIAGKEAPFSGIITAEGAIVHCLALLPLKYQCGNFFTYATFLDGIIMIAYYAHQTLKVGGFIPEYYLTWHHCNIAAQIVGRYLVFKHAIWGLESPECKNSAFRSLINLQYWGSLMSLGFYILDLHINGQTPYEIEDDKDADCKQS